MKREARGTQQQRHSNQIDKDVSTPQQSVSFVPSINQRFLSRPLKNVFEAADTRQKQAKKCSLCGINEHFELVFNTVAATQIVFQRPVNNISILGYPYVC
jgi:hypothetical protein